MFGEIMQAFFFFVTACRNSYFKSCVLLFSHSVLEKLPVGVCFQNLYMDLIYKAIATRSLILFSNNNVNLVSSQLCAVPACCHCISSYLNTNGFAFVIKGDTWFCVLNTRLFLKRIWIFWMNWCVISQFKWNLLIFLKWNKYNLKVYLSVSWKNI